MSQDLCASPMRCHSFAIPETSALCTGCWGYMDMVYRKCYRKDWGFRALCSHQMLSPISKGKKESVEDLCLFAVSGRYEQGTGFASILPC